MMKICQNKNRKYRKLVTFSMRLPKKLQFVGEVLSAAIHKTFCANFLDDKSEISFPTLKFQNLQNVPRKRKNHEMFS